MRILIDGYNLMHAKGLIPSGRTLPGGLHHPRRRFLDALADKVARLDLPFTTVVFDAADPPKGRPHQTTYKGIHVLYAVGDENADARLEALIAAHASPKQLTVVSSDRRVREAARRRRARLIDADAFWSARAIASVKLEAAPPGPAAPADRTAKSVDNDARHWINVFAEADDELRANPAPGDTSRFAPTQDELERIAREVDAEEF